MGRTWRELKTYLSAKFAFSSAANYSSSNSDGSSRRHRLPRSSSMDSSPVLPTFSLQSSTSENICAICLVNLKGGQGHAIYVAECSHSFHFPCIAGNVKHGNFSCPVCRTRWNNLPFQAPYRNGTTPVNVRRIRQEPEPFSADGVLSITPAGPISPFQKLTVRSFLQYPAISASESLSESGVLIRVCTPPLADKHHRAPADLGTVIRDVIIRIQSATPGVQVKSIESGKYKSEIIGSGDECKINIGDLYAGEEKDFLIYVSVPVFSGNANGDKVKTTSLIDITSFYKDSRSMSMIEVRSKSVEICRPPVAPCKDLSLSLEVDRHINRMLVMKAIENAQKLAETGDIVGAHSLLAIEERRLLRSASVKAGDGGCNKLQSELREVKNGMRTKESYIRYRRANALSGTSSYSLQRVTTISHPETRSRRANESSGTSSDSLQRATTISQSGTCSRRSNALSGTSSDSLHRDKT